MLRGRAAVKRVCLYKEKRKVIRKMPSSRLEILRVRGCEMAQLFVVHGEMVLCDVGDSERYVSGVVRWEWWKQCQCWVVVVWCCEWP